MPVLCLRMFSRLLVDQAHAVHVVPVAAVVAVDGLVSDSAPRSNVIHSPESVTEQPLGVLIVAPYASYRIQPFVKAATALSANVVIASEGRFALTFAGAKGVNVHFHDSEAAINTLVGLSTSENIRAVVGTDDHSVLLANEVAARLNLPHNNARAILATRRKDSARTMLRDAGIITPGFRAIDLDQPLAPQIDSITYPCVVKPVNLSMSRGVIRANNADELLAACARTEAILLGESKTNPSRLLLVEDYIEGREIAVEGILYNGVLEVLALFDKPDLMAGPFFEETYYVTPSRLDAEIKSEIASTISAACQAMGLQEGPVHAECRINEKGVWVLELAARTIGGMCSRLFEFATGQQLETIVVSHALGNRLSLPHKSPAAGVMMIPTPKAGILRRVEGLSAASRVKHIQEVVISVREGYELVPLPEGASYLGFIFATAETAGEAEQALRRAFAELNIVIAPLWKASIAS
jgi:biotin carboxylase